MSVVVMASEQEARRRQERLRVLASSVREGIDKIGALVHEARESNDHEALGYPSWTAYLSDTLGSEPMRLERDERRQVVALLAGEGMSTRAIAPIVGVHDTTVQRDLHAGAADAAPGPDLIADYRAESVNRGIAYVQEQRRQEREVTGLDGKQYTRPQTPPAPAWSDEEELLRKRLQAGETVTVSYRGKRHANLIAWAERAGRLVRIDRRSPWGNPFEVGPDGDRETVITNYAEHYLPFKPSLLAQLHTLRGKALACWCAPEPCHGDALIARAEL